MSTMSTMPEGASQKNFSAIKIARTSFFVDAVKSCDYATFLLKDIPPKYSTIVTTNWSFLKDSLQGQMCLRLIFAMA